jgi:predicted flap endonuclease-1-like 5' DNA nuclease
LELVMDLLNPDYLPYVLVAILIGVILGFLLFRPRQKVRLGDETPLRPHVSARDQTPLNPPSAPAVSAATPDEGDDFQRMKGVGPKLAQLLYAQGLHRFADIAALDDAQLSSLDDQLGAFRGRLQRDRVREQARLLASGDIEGFREQFGNLRT